MNKVISSPKAPSAVGPYSQAIVAGNTIYISGQIPIDAATGEFASNDVEGQAHQVFKNLGYVLNEAGYSFSDVVKTTVYLQDMGDFAKMNAIYAQYFSEPFPARVAVQVSALPKGALIEVDAIAVK